MDDQEHLQTSLKRFKAAKLQMEMEIYQCAKRAIEQFQARTGATPSSIYLDMVGSQSIGEEGITFRLAQVRSEIEL